MAIGYARKSRCDGVVVGDSIGGWAELCKHQSVAEHRLLSPLRFFTKLLHRYAAWPCRCQAKQLLPLSQARAYNVGHNLKFSFFRGGDVE